MTVLRLLLLSSRKKKLSSSGLSLFHSRRARSPPLGFSILMTSAPSQASICVQDGPAWSCVKSITRMPSSALFIEFCPSHLGDRTILAFVFLTNPAFRRASLYLFLGCTPNR